MRTRHCFVFAIAIILVAFAAAPVAAQGPGNSCDVTGTWYNGGYVLKITPMAAGRYHIEADYGWNPSGDWYSYVTEWTGEMSKKGAGSFEVYMMSYLTWKSAEATEAAKAFFGDMGFSVEIDPGYAELDAVRSRAELVDCNTLTNLVDVLWVYFPSESNPVPTPFLTPPSFDVLQGGTIPETYTRMPTACPSCPPLASAPTGASQAPAPKFLKYGPRTPKK